ncbi:hypothetical protein QP994_05860 [Corynebacterium sp. MSK044]|uniref:hypothetical protein n=1 Tax=Corynebacterium sp. MSK044 TaxID=3050195 RepID=UPI002550773B|nr:hypothetical protein [Corynebacterium sp. MSK044]MDK8797409.1 hypothetical protein [Corynebacterium sp. MSK044]
MAIEQQSIVVPKEIQELIDSGQLSKNGSVVRDTGGRFFTFLKEVQNDPGWAQKSGAALDEVIGKMRSATKDNPSLILAVVGAPMAVCICTAVRKTMAKRSNSKAIQERNSIEVRFNLAAKAWIEAAKTGAVKSDIVAELQEAWEAYDASNRDWKTQPSELAVSLMQLVKTWNFQNGLIGNPPAAADSSRDDVVVNLGEYLSAQRDALNETA